MSHLFATLVLSLLLAASGLFEDQAGKVDWYRQHVGRVRHALFHSAGQQRLALVATEPGVIAGLDLRTGGVSWRSVLGAGEEVALLQPQGKALLSVSVGASGAYVRLWGMLGGLTWDAHVPRVATPAATVAPPDAIVSGGMVVVCWQSTVKAFHLGTGELLWEKAFDGSQLITLVNPPSAAATSTAASTTTSGGPMAPVHVFGLSKQGALFVSVLSPLEGGRAVTAGSETTLNAGYGVTPSANMVATLDRSVLVVVDASGSRLIMHEVGSTSARYQSVPELPAGTTASLAPISLPGMLHLKTSDGGSLLLKLESVKSPPTLVRSVSGNSPHVFAHTASPKGQAVLALATLDAAAPVASALQLEVLHVNADGTYDDWSAAEGLAYDAAELGPPSAAWLNTYARKDSTFGHRLLVASADHSLQLLQASKEGSQMGWLRPEALAGVRTSELLPLPALAADSDDASSRPSFAFALPSLVESLSTRWADAAAGPASAAGAVSSGPPPAHADSYGFRQAIIATTAAGKVFGLHSTDGSVLWSRLIRAPGDGSAPAALPYLFVCRGGGAPQAVVVAQGEESWGVTALNPFSGKPVADAAGGAVGGAGSIVHAVRLDPLAPADGSSRPPVMLVDDKLAVHIYPPTAEAMAAVKSRLGDLYFYLHRPTDGTLTGYAVALDGQKLVARPRWSMSLPPSALGGARAPVTLASFPHAAAVHSPVRVLGDRNVLHKYINRNLLAIGIEHNSDGEFDEPSLQVLLIDTVSGRVVHSVSHAGMRGPLTLLMGENWLVCHFWNPKGLTYQMTVAELFRNSTIADDPIALVLGGGPDYKLRQNGLDGFVHAPPHVLSQGYGFGAPVEAMAVTQTNAGITPKNVLVATVAGQMVLLDKRFLDPRRPLVPGGPTKMTTQDREEGLVPYGNSLGGISPLTVVSHKHAVARPRGIIVASTHLESTSLALMLGVDLFMTRVAPAREFDRLNEDFNYPALVGAIAFLAIATWGSGWYSNQKDLARAWK